MFKTIEKEVNYRVNQRNNVFTISFTETLQASGSWDKSVKLWNPRTGKLIHSMTGHTGWVQALSFSNDGIYVASASDDETVRVWDVVTGSCIKVLEVSTQFLFLES